MTWSKMKPAERFAHMWKEHGQPNVEMVAEYRFHSVRRWRFDFAFPSCRVAVEVDGRGPAHRDQAVAGDNEKRNVARAMGWCVFQFNSNNVGSKAKAIECVDMVVEAIMRMHGVPTWKGCEYESSTDSGMGRKIRKQPHA